MRSTSQDSTNSKLAKKLVIGLDGVGFTQFKKLQEGGYFRRFKPVAPMVSSFPSLSDPNWALIMNVTPEPSYTREHIDMSYRDGNKVGRRVGSLIDHVSQPPKYETAFDFRPEGMIQHLASMTWSETTGLYWLDAIEKDLLSSTNKEVYKAFIVNTDFIAHTKGEESLLRYLAEVDKKLEGLEKRYQEKMGHSLEIVLVSDHGNVFLKPKPILVNDLFAQKKWNIAEHIQSERDVIYTIPEILSFGAFYTHPKSALQLAKDLTTLDGVHVTLTMENNTRILIHSKNSLLQIDVQPKPRLINYVVLKGKDPFGHRPLFKNGPLRFSDYFNDRIDSFYAYAAVRAWEAFTKNSLQKPSVLVSPHRGFVFSNRALEWITAVMGLESVHGSFDREETFGILVSNTEELTALPSSDVYKNVIESR